MVASVTRGIRPLITTLIGVALAGALLGGVVGAVAAAAGSPTSLLASGEHPAALRYAVALATKDIAAADGVRPLNPIAVRARELQDAEANRRYEPLALSFVGGATSGPISVWVYVLEETDPDVGVVRAPFVVTVHDGVVIRQRP